MLSISPSQFMDVLELTELVAEFRLPAKLASDYGVTGRIRGAWGRALLRKGTEGAQVADLFLGASENAAKPFCILVDDTGNRLVVRLRLFGASDTYRDLAFDCLLESLCVGDGLDMGRADHHRRTLELLDASWSKSVGLPVPSHNSTEYLRFVTPLWLRSGKAFSMDYRKLWSSVHGRMASFASWHGLKLSQDALPSMRDVVFDDSEMLVCTPWERWSGRRGTRQQMTGLIGKLRLANVAAELAPYLGFGENALIGTYCSFGLGRYHLNA